jgi:hypothetical protein
MSTTTVVSPIIEHFVLFKVKPDTDPSKISAMVNGLNSLSSLDSVVYINAGDVIRSFISTPVTSSLTFTHMLHSRYKSKEDLAAYAAHPAHVSVVTESIRPIIDDLMAVDFVADAPVNPIPGSVMRVSLFKLKDGLGEKEKSEVLGVIEEFKNQIKASDEFSFGGNFSPERAKGFSIVSLAVLNGLSDLDAVETNKEKLKDLVDSVVTLDYMIPKIQSASL